MTQLRLPKAFIILGLIVGAAGRAELPETDQTAAAESAAVKMDPYVVVAPKTKPGTWNTVLKTLNFAIGKKFMDLRGGPLLDAIFYRTNFLVDHPGERAIVVISTEPVHGRVTAATTVFTEKGDLFASSAALGNHVRLTGFSAVDIDKPERIRKELQARRDAYLLAAGDLDKGHVSADVTALSQAGSDAASSAPAANSPLDPSSAQFGLLESQAITPQGVYLARAEETGDYSGVMNSGIPGLVSEFGGGDTDELLTVTYDTLHAGTQLPIQKTKLMLDETSIEHPTVIVPKMESVVIFDWDQMHYLFNPDLGTYGIPIPKNLVTGRPALVVKQGDFLESLYFFATFKAQHPNEQARILPPVDGRHEGVAYTLDGRLWIYSPALGRFGLPARYRINDLGALIKLQSELVARQFATGKHAENATIDELPGDTPDVQTRRASLALAQVGFGCKLESVAGQPTLTVSWPNGVYTYRAPAAQRIENSFGEGTDSVHVPLQIRPNSAKR